MGRVALSRNTVRQPPTVRQLIFRGLRRRCPRCGRGALFQGFMKVRANCSVCNLVYEKDPGATWAFWVLGDRIFVAALLVPIYLGLDLHGSTLKLVLFGLVATALIATMPHRQGVALAIDFLTRVRWGDEGEELLRWGDELDS